MLSDKVEVRLHRLFGFECRGLFAKAPIKVGGSLACVLACLLACLLAGCCSRRPT